MMDLLDEYNKMNDPTAGLTQKKTERGQQVTLRVERKVEIRDFVTNRRTASLSDVLRMSNLTQNSLQTPSSFERLKK